MWLFLFLSASLYETIYREIWANELPECNYIEALKYHVEGYMQASLCTCTRDNDITLIYRTIREGYTLCRGGKEILYLPLFCVGKTYNIQRMETTATLGLPASASETRLSSLKSPKLDISSTFFLLYPVFLLLSWFLDLEKSVLYQRCFF